MKDANKSDLGDFITEYSYQKRPANNVIIPLAIGGILFVIGYGSASLDRESMVGLLTIPGLLGLIIGFGFGFFYMLRSVLNWTNKVVLYQQGFIYEIRRKKDTVRWKDIRYLIVEPGSSYQEGDEDMADGLGIIAGVLLKAHLIQVAEKEVKVNLKYTIAYGRNGFVTIAYQYVDRVHELMDQIRQHFAPHLITALEAGESIDVGGVTLSKEGIIKESEIVPWDKIQTMADPWKLPINDSLSIKIKDQWRALVKIPNWETPNAGLLYKLVNHMVSEK